MNDKYWISQAMQIYGGSFVHKLGELYLLADSDNAKKLERCFEEYFEGYRGYAEELKRKEKQNEKV